MSTLHAFGLFLPPLVSLWLGLWHVTTNWHARTTPVRLSLTPISATLTALAGLQTAALITPDADLKRLFFQLSFFPLALLPWFWVAVAHSWVRWPDRSYPGQVIPAAVSATLTFVLVLTNGLHGAVWNALPLVETASLPMIAAQGMNWGAWVILVALIAGYILSWLRLRRATSRVPVAITAALVSSALFTISSIWRPMFNLEASLDPAGLMLIVTTALVVTISVRFPAWPQLLAYGPVAESKEALIRLDADERVLETNRAAAELLAEHAAVAPGSRLRELLPLSGAALVGQEFTHPERNDRNYRLQQLPWVNPTLPGDTLLQIVDITPEKEEEQRQEQMLRKVIHDLRNPLSSSLTMLGFLEKQGSRLAPERQEQMVSLATRSLQRGIALVNRLADIHRLETGDMILDCTLVDLIMLVDGAQSTVLSQHREKELAIFSDIDMDLPPVWADARQLEQIILELLGNAAQYSAKGGEITIRALATDNDKLEISIRDNGPGVSASLVPRLFQKFETGNLTGQGTGLGLAFCRLALAAHGQAIWLDTGADEGACFKFTLPVAPEKYQVEPVT